MQGEFNHSYCGLLRQLEQALNGSPARIGAAVGTMFRIREQAQALMRMPTGDGAWTAGPTFEYVAPRPAELTAVQPRKPQPCLVTVRRHLVSPVRCGVE